jgi:predicted kinase
MPETERRLVMTVGLPRSGKSTWARQVGSPIVNPDAIRLSLHGASWRAEAEPMVWAVAKLMVAALFEAGHDQVILDATNTTRARRDDWEDKRWHRIYMPFDTPKEVCAERAIATGKPDLLPVIERMAAAFEPVQEEEWD